MAGAIYEEADRVGHDGVGHSARFFVAVLVAVLLVWVDPSLTMAQALAPAEPPPLELGQPMTRDVPKREERYEHVYTLRLTAGDFAEVVISGRGFESLATISSSDGKEVLTTDLMPTSKWERFVWYVAETSGDYRLTVSSRSYEADAKCGVTLATRRPATAADRSRTEAMARFVSGMQSIGKLTAEDRTKGIADLEAALVTWRAIGDRTFEQITLHEIGTAYSFFGRYREAAEYIGKAAAVAGETGDRAGEAVMLADVAACIAETGDTRKAIALFEEVIPRLHADRNFNVEHYVLVKIYDCRMHLGEIDAAWKAIERAETVARAGGFWTESLYDMQKGALLMAGGDVNGALARYESALANARTSKDLIVEYRSLLRQSEIYGQLGEVQKSLDLSTEALAKVRIIGWAAGLTYTLTRVAGLYHYLGDVKKADLYYAEAVKVAAPTGQVIALSVVNIGQANLHLERREFGEALGLFETAAAAGRSAGIVGVEIAGLRGAGDTLAADGKVEQAVASYERALEASKDRGPGNHIPALLLGIGAAYAARDAGRAIPYLERALETGRATRDRRVTAAALYRLALLARDRGDAARGLGYIEEAVDVVESLRSSIKSAELRASYFATVQDYYSLYVDLLMRGNRGEAPRAAEALRVAERGRARVLLESLAERGVDLSQGVDSRLYEMERQAQRRLAGRLDYQVRLLGRDHQAADAAELRREIDVLEARLQAVRADIRKASPAYAALTQPAPVTVDEVRRELDASTVLVEYALGERRSYVWAVTPTGVASAELPTRAEIEARARRVRDLLVARSCPVRFETDRERAARLAKADAEYTREAAALSKMVLGPIATAIAGKRLVVVADGALQFVPFAALPDPGGVGYLIERHEVAMVPSATALLAQRRTVTERAAAPKTVVVLADPVFEATDTRVGEAKAETSGEATAKARNAADAVRGDCDGRGGLERLEASRREAEAIGRLVPASERLEALDFRANLELATSGRLGEYRMVHFATHGYVPAESPELSGLVLSLVDESGKEREGYLGLPQVYGMKLPAEVVTLSACETGLGREVRGEGLVGLVRGFMYAGARRVVASLWKVDDRETAELMAEFYRGMLVEKRRPAEALRAAQVRMIRTKRAPYFWAAFQLHGEWR